MARSTLVPSCFLVFAGLVAVVAPADAKIYYCERGAQDRPCDDVKSPAAAPRRPAPTGCRLDADQRKRAERLEDQFLTRYPDEAAHRRAQVADLQPVVARIRTAQKRYAELAAERKPLDKEGAFYEKKPMPAWLRSKLDANDAQFAALADILKGREQEIAEIQGRYQCQRDTFGKIWAGAAAGSSACDRPTWAQP